jgi:hypothetical protein
VRAEVGALTRRLEELSCSPAQPLEAALAALVTFLAEGGTG